MLIFRRLLSGLLAITALVVLLSAAQALTINLAFASPQRIEKLLADSKIYDNFVANVLQQAQKSASSDNGGISATDEAVIQAAEAAFPPAELQTYVNTFIEANYAWLQGKTDKPQFEIDLTEAKETFATNVGKAVEAHLASLPVCTASQQAALNNQDPLTLECRPSNVNPQQAGKDVEAKLLSGGVLSTPVITADSLTPDGGTPYYKQANVAPQVYRAVTFAPYTLVIVFVILCILIYFITPRRRSGTRVIGFVMLIAGALLVLSKYAADVAFQKSQAQLFDDSEVGPLQQSVADFFQQLEHFIAGYYLYIGIACVVLGILFIVLSLVKKSKNTALANKVSATENALVDNVPTQTPRPSPQTQPQPTTPRVTAPLTPRSTASTSRSATKPKRPRLIQ